METKTLHEKLAIIQGEISVPKSKFNEFGKYKYREADDILKAAMPFTKAMGLVITQTDDIVMIGQRIYVKATASISDGKDAISASAFAREPEVKKGMDESQITGTASSYARKNAMGGLLGLNGIPDSDSATTDKGMTAPKNKPISNELCDTVIPYGANEGLSFKEVSTKELLDLCNKIIKVNKDEGIEIPKEEQEFMTKVKTYLKGGKK